MALVQRYRSLAPCGCIDNIDMISSRTRLSLAQFLELFEPALVVVLLNKHSSQQHPTARGTNLAFIVDLIENTQQPGVLQVLAELVNTTGDMRARVSPKLRFDERWHDLTQCLALDGYTIDSKKLLQSDPSITATPPIDDDLIEALRTCGAPRSEQTIQLIEASTQAFRASPPDYNAALTNARVALETIAGDVAGAISSPNSSSYNPAKWGEVLGHLRKGSEVSVEEEKGLAGVFGFLSPGAHRPIGIPEAQMARLGRTLALNMCWFLLKNRLAKVPTSNLWRSYSASNPVS